MILPFSDLFVFLSLLLIFIEGCYSLPTFSTTPAPLGAEHARIGARENLIEYIHNGDPNDDVRKKGKRIPLPGATSKIAR